jgi:hypothetical protein
MLLLLGAAVASPAQYCYQITSIRLASSIPENFKGNYFHRVNRIYMRYLPYAVCCISRDHSEVSCALSYIPELLG